MVLLGIWLAASLLFGVLWALAGLMLRERPRDPQVAVEPVDEAEEAA